MKELGVPTYLYLHVHIRLAKQFIYEYTYISMYLKYAVGGSHALYDVFNSYPVILYHNMNTDVHVENTKNPQQHNHPVYLSSLHRTFCGGKFAGISLCFSSGDS